MINKALTYTVLFGISLVPSTAFVPTSRGNLHQAALAVEKSSEEYLRELWQDEKLVERDIVVQETLKGNEEDVTKHVVTEMLETALEHLKVLEKEKAKHAKDANDRFEHAAQEERVLHEFVEDYNLGDDAPVVDNYISSRLHEAEREELEAIKEEDEAVREYQDLKTKEENIKDLLEQMKKLGP
jgi:hypothetical protein